MDSILCQLKVRLHSFTSIHQSLLVRLNSFPLADDVHYLLNLHSQISNNDWNCLTTVHLYEYLDQFLMSPSFSFPVLLLLLLLLFFGLLHLGFQEASHLLIGDTRTSDLDLGRLADLRARVSFGFLEGEVLHLDGDAVRLVLPCFTEATVLEARPQELGVNRPDLAGLIETLISRISVLIISCISALVISSYASKFLFIMSISAILALALIPFFAHFSLKSVVFALFFVFHF
jgi:hypothetical protein